MDFAPDGLTQPPDPAIANKLAGDEFWSADFGRSGVYGIAHALCSYGVSLVVAGDFSYAGPVQTDNIAMWDGAAWNSLGGGVGRFGAASGRVFTVAEYEGRLIAGGELYGAGGDTITGLQAASWGGTSWSPMGAGALSGWVEDLEVYHDQLYATGFFDMGDTSCAAAVWNGTAWDPLPTPFVYGPGMVVHEDRLLFLSSSIYVWDGVDWSAPYGHACACGTAVTAFIKTAVAYDGGLVVGGEFGGIGPEGAEVPARCIAYWDGTTWHALDGGLYGFYDDYDQDIARVYSVAVRDGQLYAGGVFEKTSSAGVEANVPYVATWDGQRWSAPGGGTTRYAHALLEYGGDLIVAGWMAFAGHVDLLIHTGDTDVWGLARWDGATWSTVGPPGLGADGPVECLGRYGTEIVAAGEFEHIGGVKAKNIACFDGTRWRALGAGIGYSITGSRMVSAVTEFEGDLVVCGLLTSAGGQPASGVARWDGSAWHAMGSGVPGGATALTVYDGTLYCGTCRWTGTEWEPFFAVDSVINAYCEWGGGLVLGGRFTMAGGQPAKRIVLWRDGAYSPIGDGVGGYEVRALVRYQNQLVAGGAIGGPFVDFNYYSAVARWDGTVWRGFSYGFDIGATALAVHGDYLFAGGLFETTCDELPPNGRRTVNHVACWNGSSWQALGSGCGGAYYLRLQVFGLAFLQDHLIVGGDFTMAGGKPSWYLGWWRDPAVPVVMRSLNAERWGGAARIWGEVSAAGSLSAFEVWREDASGERKRVGMAPVLASGSFEYLDASAPAYGVDYWLRESGSDDGSNWYGPVHVGAIEMPSRVFLAQNIPNPFNPRTTIRFGLPRQMRAVLGLYDQRGRLVRTLVDESLPAGERQVEWDGRDGRGQAVASGTYVVRLVTEQGVRTSKITLAK